MAKQPPYSDDDIKIVSQLYPTTRNAEIAKVIGRSLSSVNHLGQRCGFKKDKAFIAQMSAEAWINNPNHGGKAGFFKKGVEHPFRGIKKSPEARAKVEHLFFKKGNIPHNAKANGYRSIDTNGYHKIKTDKGMEFLHRKIWEDNNGEIPDNYLVSFKDGDRNNCNIENLVLVSRQNNMSCNSIRNYPPEVRQTINLISKLKKTIKNGNTKTN